MARAIFCRCGVKVGEIRDASLMVGISYLCPKCSEAKPSKEKTSGTSGFGDPVDELLIGIEELVKNKSGGRENAPR